jgi:NitT/TauT family transport system permease protein
VVISFLMALPIMYTNVLEGLLGMDKKLLEMAAVYEVPASRRIVYIYFSQLMPFLVSACSLSLGLCWKSGIAAEVIGLPLGSIGEHLYQAKIFVDTKTLLAWTVVVIAVSFLFERVFLAFLKKLAAAVERM